MLEGGGGSEVEFYLTKKNITWTWDFMARKDIGQAKRAFS